MSRWTQGLFGLNTVSSTEVKDGEYGKDWSNRQDSRWTWADGKEYEANTISRKFCRSACLTVVSVHQELNHSHAAGGCFFGGRARMVFACLGFFFNICIIATEGIKATRRRIKRQLCRCLQGELRAQIISWCHLYLPLERFVPVLV